MKTRDIVWKALRSAIPIGAWHKAIKVRDRIYLLTVTITVQVHSRQLTLWGYCREWSKEQNGPELTGAFQYLWTPTQGVCDKDHTPGFELPDRAEECICALAEAYWERNRTDEMRLLEGPSAVLCTY